MAAEAAVLFWALSSFSRSSSAARISAMILYVLERMSGQNVSGCRCYKIHIDRYNATKVVDWRVLVVVMMMDGVLLSYIWYFEVENQEGLGLFSWLAVDECLGPMQLQT